MISGYSTSKHLLDERADRLIQIATTTGFGELKYKKKLPNNLIAGFTNTGVMCVIDHTDSFIITMYFANLEKTAAIFKGNIPKDLLKQIHSNMKKGYV